MFTGQKIWFMEVERYYGCIFKKLNEAQKIDKITKLQTKIIDRLISSKKINEINYISLDTQGSELDILKGASQNLVEKLLV